VISVPTTTPSFAPWRGPSPGDTYNRKPLLDFNGRAGFAELGILWSFMQEGWQGAWVDTYRNRFLRDFWPAPVPVEIPPDRKDLLQSISTKAQGLGKPWDVFCWSPSGGVVFAEAKRNGRDRIRSPQIAFLGATLDLGLPLSSFLLVEWSIA
jgi:hypothetical protein